jgi:RimJ/RimL family protein N-acetyltransferase
MTQRPPTKVPGSSSSSPVEIRPIRSSDAASYVDLLNELDQETTFLLWEPGERSVEVEELRGRLASVDHSNRVCIVAACDDRLVGFLVGLRGPVRRTRHRADFTMAVLGGYRRRSIGTGLLHQLEVWAVENEISRLELTVMAHNQGARSLYERCGFMLEGTKHGAIRVAGELIDECVMGKPLKPRGGPNRALRNH